MPTDRPPDGSRPRPRGRRGPRPAIAARLAAGLLAAVGLLPAACSTGAGPAMAPVAGTVTVQGKPATRGVVTFYPVDATGGSPAMGAIGSDGSYTLQTARPGDGVRLGEYRVGVALEAGEPSMEDTVKATARGTRPAPRGPLARYESPETSGLRATDKAGPNTIPLELR